jgi:phosphatidylglycerophosphate synthase
VNVALVYKKTRKIPDLFWNLYVCRPVAAVFVDLLKDTRVTPNQVTISAVGVAAISAGMLIAWPGYAGLVAAVLVFQASYVLDCVDGMLARWRGIQSTQGHLLDFLMDEIKAFVMLAAVAVRLFRQHDDPKFLLLGIAGLVALASGIALTTFQRRPEIAPSSAAATGATATASLLRRAVRVAENAGKFLIHYPSYIFYAALVGRIELYFYPYLVVNALYALRAFASVVFRFGRPSA